MLPKHNRLKKKIDIEATLKKGKGTFSDISGVKALNTGGVHSRIAFAAGLKVSKKAVVRNKLKRQYRSHMRKLLPGMKEGYDVLLILSKKAIDLPFEDQFTVLQEVLKKAKLL